MIRLFRNRIGMGYVRKVHNQLQACGVGANSRIRIRHYGYHLTPEQMEVKHIRRTLRSVDDLGRIVYDVAEEFFFSTASGLSPRPCRLPCRSPLACSIITSSSGCWWAPRRFGITPHNRKNRRYNMYMTPRIIILRACLDQRKKHPQCPPLNHIAYALKFRDAPYR